MSDVDVQRARWPRAAQALACWIGALLLIAGCGGGDVPPALGPSPVQPQGVATIGPGGGTVQGVDGVSVTVPPGALADPVTIRIARANPGTLALPDLVRSVGATYELTPHGIEFAQGVTVRIPIDRSALGPNGRVLVAKSAPSGEWTLHDLPRQAVVGDAVEMPVSSFSYFQPVTWAMPEAPGGPAVTLAPDPLESVLRFTPDTDSRGLTTYLAQNALPAPQWVRMQVDVSPTLRCSRAQRGVTITDERGGVVQYGDREGLPPQAVAGADVVGFVPSVRPGLLRVTGWVDCTFDSFNQRTLRILGTSTVAQFQLSSNDQSRFLSTEITPHHPLLQALPLNVSLWVYHGINAPGSDAVTISYEFTDEVGRTRNETVGILDPAPGCRFNGACEYRGELHFRSPAQAQGKTLVARLGNLQLIHPRPIALVPHYSPAVRFRSDLSSPDTLNVAAGQTANIEVFFEGAPAPLLVWERRLPGSPGWDPTFPGKPAERIGLHANLTTPVVSEQDHGTLYQVLAVDQQGVRQPMATFRVVVSAATERPAITGQPTDLSVREGDEALFSATVTGAPPLSYQWYRAGQPIQGALAPTLRLPAAAARDSGLYQLRVTNPHGLTDSRIATLTVAPLLVPQPPSIVAPPRSLSVGQGDTAVFAVSASGDGPMRFQWQFNGADIPGATDASLVRRNVEPGDAGSYGVRVMNDIGQATSSGASLTVTAPQLAAPIISSQPVGLTVAPGGMATLAVAASGSAPLAYQWWRNGAAILGADRAALVLDPVDALSAGDYHVVVSNPAGTVRSVTVRVGLVGAPAITGQPIATRVVQGQPFSFAVTASGSALRYQWARNGVAIPGATQARLVATAVPGDNGALYSAIVYNGAGVQLSQPALLQVDPPAQAPSVAEQPVDVAVASGQTARFAMRFDGTLPVDIQPQQWLSGQWQPVGGPLTSVDGRLDWSSPALMSETRFRFQARNSAGQVSTRDVLATIAPSRWSAAVPLGQGIGYAATVSPHDFVAAMQLNGRLEGHRGTWSTGWASQGHLDLPIAPGFLEAIGGNSVAGDGSGLAVALWRSPGGLSASTYRTGSGWGAGQLLGSGGYQQVAVRAGRAAAVWHALAVNQSDAMWSVLTANGWTQARQLNTLQTPSHDIQVSMNAHGAGLVAFREQDTSIVVVPFDAAGQLGAPQVLRQAAGGLRVPRVAMYDDGTAVVVWLERIGNTGDLYHSRLGPSGWSTPSRLAANVGVLGNTGIVMASSGTRSVLAYAHGGDGTRVFYQVDSAPGGFDGAVATTAPDVASWQPRVAMAASGALAITFVQARQGEEGVVAVRVVGATGSIADQVLSTPGFRVTADRDIAISPTGQAAILWYEFSGNNSQNGRLMASFWPG